MAPPQRRERIVPCVKCREKHLKCDGDIPCSHCKKSESRCTRVNNKFRFKRVVTTEKQFSFDVDQPWLQTTPDTFQARPLAIVDESRKPSEDTPSKLKHALTAPISDTISQNGEANNQHDDQIHDQITVAAELLQSISQREHSNPSESIGTSRVPTHQSRLRTNQSPPRGETTPEDVPQIALEDAIDPNLAATPAASSTIETPYSGFSAPSPSVPRSIPDGWDRRTPDIGGSRLSVLSQQWQLPLGDNRGRSSSVSRSLGGELHLGLQEGCLIRCFIEHLAAAVSWVLDAGRIGRIPLSPDFANSFNSLTRPIGTDITLL
ncbi:uncharacterized protein CLUP02_09602 [Colletotrichum lupini]|uniref:Zn(2)-C6 fungal-type domain-containing protein n=1 Tax=Colletotrichum lupini TaxID=145971 RepID=A0A9Q8SV61_9PEZI|nr:uncharacterized protein CLUP02_09602 [Colletotrichum lupini]UQC84106.1 hypothetical protein CLUP02_09602 [Colletotrichum lupini]